MEVTVKKLFGVMNSPITLENLMQMLCKDVIEKPENYNRKILDEIKKEHEAHECNPQKREHPGFKEIIESFK